MRFGNYGPTTINIEVKIIKNSLALNLGKVLPDI